MRKRATSYLSLFIILLLLNGYLTIPISFGLQGSQNIPSQGTIRYSKLLKLHVQGTRIVDSLGNEVKLSGFNIHSVPSPTDPEPYRIAEDDIKWISGKGFNCVRVVIYWSDFEPTQGVYKEAFFSDHLDPIISWCEKYGVYIILDMHQWQWSPWFTSLLGEAYGFPTWACNMYPQLDEGMEQCAVDFWKDVGQGAITKAKFVDAWRFVANRYKGKNVIAAYQLFNDPIGFSNGRAHALEMGSYMMDLYNNILVPAIRAVDPDTICIYHIIEWPLTANTRQTQPNIAWGEFWYRWSWENTGEPYTEEKYDSMKADFKMFYDQYCGDFNAPLIDIEIGCNFTLEGNLLWVDDAFECMNELASLYGGQGHFMWWRYGKGREWLPRNEDGSDRPVVAILQKYIHLTL